MSIPVEQPNRYLYAGNGVTDDFNFDCFVRDDGDIKVYLIDDATAVKTIQAITTDYSIALTDDGDSGGVVTFVVPPPSGNTILIEREFDALTQDAEFRPSSKFPEDVIEHAYDIGVAYSQQLKNGVARSLKIPAEDSASISDLPMASERANKALIFDATGDITISTDDYEEQATAAAASALEASVYATDSLGYANASSASSVTASEWAIKTSAAVSGGEFSAKAHAIGATGLTTGPAKDWAIKTDAAVSGGEFSAKAHAIGATGLTTGSAKDWATKAEDSAVVAGEYSSLHWAAKSEGFADAASDSADAAAASAASLAVPDPAVANSYLQRNAGNTAYEAKTAANVLSDIMGGTTASSTDIVLGKRTTNPSQPMFYAIKATLQDNVTGDGTAATFIADNQLNDVGDCYNPSTGVFTAPVSGLYMLSFCVGLSGITSSHTGANIQLITSNRIHATHACNPYACQYNHGGDIFLALAGSVATYMDAGDTAFIRVYVGGGTKVVDLSAGCSNFFFSGYLVA